MENYIFQKYQSKENVMTANFLFFLNNVRRISERVYVGFIWSTMKGEVPEDNNMISPKFKNQDKSQISSSVPDATISQASNKIVIETKGNGANFNERQIIGHLNHFSNEDLKVFLTLDKYELDSKSKEMIKKLVEEKNDETRENDSHQQIKHVHLRFKDVIDKINDIVDSTREFDLVDLINEYEKYLQNEGLIDDIEGRMRMVLAGHSIEVNKKLNIYFHPAEKRGYRYNPVEYIGLYNNKAIRAIGKVKHVVISRPTDDGFYFNPIYPPGTFLDGEEEKGIEEKIQKSAEMTGWDIITKEPYYIYIVESFEDTEFKKVSPGGAMGVRYFNLHNIFQEKYSSTMQSKDLASHLKEHYWY